MNLVRYDAEPVVGAEGRPGSRLCSRRRRSRDLWSLGGRPRFYLVPSSCVSRGRAGACAESSSCLQSSRDYCGTTGWMGCHPLCGGAWLTPIPPCPRLSDLSPVASDVTPCLGRCGPGISRLRTRASCGGGGGPFSHPVPRICIRCDRQQGPHYIPGQVGSD